MSPSAPPADTDVVVAGAVRTPIGKFGGALAGMTAAELGSVAGREALRRSGVPPSELSEVIFGCARQAGGGPNVARQIGWRSGVPASVPAFTVNKACGSGLKAILSAAQAIRLGDASVVLAGGAESMSRVPYLLETARWGTKLGDSPLVDGMHRDGFLCPLCGQLMGETAETLADRHGIGRGEQDAYAAMSQNRAEAARREGRFAEEIAAVELPPGRDGVARSLAADEHPRDGVTPGSMAGLPPVFREQGSVHAGNSSGITDGAAAMVVTTLGEARRRGLAPQARLRGYATAGVDPAVMGIGPVPAVRALLSRAGVSLAEVDLIELNEAFAAQVLACARELELDLGKVNVNGGSIALGHPIGASGARIVVTLLHEMRRRGARLGLATLCISGGMGIAALFESLPG
ncbi:MAG TPA: acetyl-CoA C-acetyltransferase [Candidatus Polarisedimenticolia bacterium]|nr:acetyl-CoA C-acetyltransferase [Candidatus Polarisedimenticolia bacterium]